MIGCGKKSQSCGTITVTVAAFSHETSCMNTSATRTPRLEISQLFPKWKRDMLGLSARPLTVVGEAEPGYEHSSTKCECPTLQISLTEPFEILVNEKQHETRSESLRQTGQAPTQLVSSTSQNAY